MLGEIEHKSCPLCKRAFGPGSTAPNTKLCEPCRDLVTTAFSGRVISAKRNGSSVPAVNSAYSSILEHEPEPKFLPALAGNSFGLHAEPAFEPAGVSAQPTFDSNFQDSESKQAELPAWDYSQGDWPVLLGPARGTVLSRLKPALIVIAVLAIAAAFYFLFLPALQEPRTNSPAQERAPVAVEPAAPGSDSQTPKSSQPAAPAEPVNAHGKFALQAAAFPSQAEADALADKLKGAGIPSYVVGTDLARRGKWFRVRVGRFNTAEDAQKFAAEALARAKSAGTPLQLMVVPYEQP
jgi:cell division septation protein DedD